MTANAAPPSLTILGGPLAGRGTPVGPGETLIGSDPSCHLQIPGASPVHARIRVEAEGYVLHEGHSAAGTWVNDDRVQDRAVLRDSDILWVLSLIHI